MAAKLLALRRTLPPGRFLVLIFVKGRVELRHIVRMEGLLNTTFINFRTVIITVTVATRDYSSTVRQNIKLSLLQAVKTHGVVRRRGSHIFSRPSAHRWR
jgi:hypothetical protein